MAGAPITSLDVGGAALLRPGERDYERAVATDNLLYRFSRPLFVVQPRNAGQVRTIVNEARAKKLRITIKNGGHSYAGSSTADGGILLDLSRLSKVTLEMKPRSQTPEFATLEGGAKWGHVYKELVNGRHDGYIINGGRCPTVGVSGFI
jgi:FAD/FMN-containing dehydrogenase